MIAFVNVSKFINKNLSGIKDFTLTSLGVSLILEHSVNINIAFLSLLSYVVELS